jgi:predicted ATPase with chaperone activity
VAGRDKAAWKTHRVRNGAIPGNRIIRRMDSFGSSLFDLSQFKIIRQVTASRSTASCLSVKAPGSACGQVHQQAIGRLGLSACGYHRVPRLARTLPDLAEVEQIDSSHIAGAVQYRRFDK